MNTNVDTPVPNPVDDMLKILRGTPVAVVDRGVTVIDYLFSEADAYMVYNTPFTYREVSEISLTKYRWTIYLKDLE